MTLVVPTPTPNPTLDRIRALQPLAHQHVGKQHVVTKAILKRFGNPVPVAGAARGHLADFNLDWPEATIRFKGPKGCGYVSDFVRYASASMEQVWKETEDRLPAAIDACLTQTALADPATVEVLKNAIVMHHVRSVHIRAYLDGIWDVRVTQLRHSFLHEQRAVTERAFVTQFHGLVPGPGCLEALIDEAMAPHLALKEQDAYFRESLERLYRLASSAVTAHGLEISTTDTGDFLISDAPALAIAEHGRLGLRDGVGLKEAITVALPLTPQCLISLGDNDTYLTLDRQQTDAMNWHQIRSAAHHVYFRPGSGLETFIRANLPARR
ncbi:DUF4238 domain-containing protein [Catelliglobosispora koreensis]|uniref:DUF4238 domain-containing protein n=1 Tax=Catelliglobosispora koreensis TaxID=129052 RepID=UPI000362FFA9|nr:DUF4238 domain-containing protein [Catelliglobosispora koreensis]